MRRFFTILCTLAALVTVAGQTSSPYGPTGAEGEPNREQRWLVPTTDGDRPARAALFRPQGEGPFRLALVAHATTQDVLRRAQMPQPEYRALAAFLVASGFAVLVPERLRHGATGGAYLEDQGGCDEADYARSGRATAEQIIQALDYMPGRPFIRRDGAVILGHSAGAWGALALAGEDPKSISTIVLFGPGRGGHANGFENQICAPHTLMAAARAFGSGSGSGQLAGRGERYLFLARFFAKTGRGLSQRGRNCGVCRAASFGQQRALAGGDGDRRQARRACARSRLEAS